MSGPGWRAGEGGIPLPATAPPPSLRVLKTMKLRLCAVAFGAVSVLASAALADPRVDTWIAKARAAVGPEIALNRVTSIHFTGTLATTQQVPVEGPGGATREEQIVLGIDIVFQRPYRQRMILRSDKVVETTALDEYDAWLRRAAAPEEKRWQVTLLDAQQVKRLRANTWENLNFFAGLARRGGRVEFGGETVVDGRSCVKLSFIHDEEIAFIRYFDAASGRLVKTETENGAEIREEGELVVEGLRFPKRLVNRAPNGQVATITFDSVTINQPLPADAFAVPAFAPGS